MKKFRVALNRRRVFDWLLTDGMDFDDEISMAS